VPYSGKDVEGRDFHLPVFVFVFTKFRKMPNAKLVRYNCILYLFMFYLFCKSVLFVSGVAIVCGFMQ